MICPTCRVISNMLALKSNHKYVVIFIFIYELLSIGGLGKSKTKRAESPMLSIAQGNALPFIHIFDNSQHLTFAEEIVKSCFESCISWT